MKAASDATLQDAVDYYLRQLRAGDYESAFHGLTELDSAIVYPLVATYRTETSSGIRDSLLRIISEFRTPSALPLLAEVLRDRRDTDGSKLSMAWSDSPRSKPSRRSNPFFATRPLRPTPTPTISSGCARHSTKPKRHMAPNPMRPEEARGTDRLFVFTATAPHIFPDESCALTPRAAACIFRA